MGPQDLGVAQRREDASGIELRIEALAAGGRGVARRDGVVWFVDSAFPGDRVQARVVRRRARYVEARVERVLESSAHRRHSPCPIQDRCGGCPWMPLEEGEQRDWKREILRESLTRIGGLSDPPVTPVIPSPQGLAYRNKVEFSLAAGPDGKAILGFRAPDDPGRITSVERCLLPHEGANRILEYARELLVDGPGVLPPGNGEDPLRIVVRRSGWTGAFLVAMRGPAGSFSRAEEFARGVTARIPEVASVVRIVSRPGRRGGARVEPLAGDPWIEDRLAGLVFRVHASAFWQVNSPAAEELVSSVERLATEDPPRRVVEVYGGSGVFSLSLARRGASAVVCEADGEAVASGRQAARANGKLPVRFVRSDALRFLATRRESGTEPPDLVLADPPRTGLGRGVAAALAELGAPRIVLVSCDAPTLGRDVRDLVARRYQVRNVIPVDLFPQTPHVEAVALLHRT